MQHSYPKIRLFVEFSLSQGATIHCADDQAHYLTRVMRVKPDEELALFNGADGEWRARVTQTAKKSVTLEVLEQLRPYLPPPDIWLCFAPIKFGRIDYLVQKATELGVARLQPVFTQYTQAERIKLERLRANAIEAAEQCERVEVPEIMEPIDLPKLLASWPTDRTLLYGDESGSGAPIHTWLQTSPSGPLAILIGPEGGFSETERHILRSKATPVGLGPRILRADTAAIAMLAVLQSALGDWCEASRFMRQEKGA